MDVLKCANSVSATSFSEVLPWSCFFQYRKDIRLGHVKMLLHCNVPLQVASGLAVEDKYAEANMKAFQLKRFRTARRYVSSTVI